MVLESKNSRSGYRHGLLGPSSGLQTADFLLCPHMAERVRDLSGMSFIRALITFMGAPASRFKHFPRSHLWDLGFQHVNWGWGAQTFRPQHQVFAHSVLSAWNSHSLLSWLPSSCPFVKTYFYVPLPGSFLSSPTKWPSPLWAHRTVSTWHDSVMPFSCPPQFKSTHPSLSPFIISSGKTSEISPRPEMSSLCNIRSQNHVPGWNLLSNYTHICVWLFGRCLSTWS